jgi:hypothetical protein
LPSIASPISNPRDTGSSCQRRAAFNRELIEAHVSAGPTHASASGFPRWIRFVLVNGRASRADAECALCGIKIENGYVREPQTCALYCDTQCFVGHAIAIKDQVRKRKVS